MSNKKQCTCNIPFSDCPHAMETPHGDKWYCTLPTKTNNKMENQQCEALIINDYYYADLETYANCHFANKEEIEATDEDDYPIAAYTCETKPLQVFNAEWIAGAINEEKFSEDGAESEYDRIVEALNTCIDFEKLNEMIPRMNYPTKNQIYISKQDLIEAF